MAELTGEIGTEELTQALLARYGILIKDLRVKMGGKKYIRLAVRNEEEDNVLLDALRKEVF